jgi:hypothetical protein
MKKANPALLLAAAITLCTNSAVAQGTMLYTWHGYGSQLFHASFQIYDFEQTPGTWFSGTHLYEQTITVTSPDHTWVGGGGYASGYRGVDNSLVLDVMCSDLALSGVKVYVTATGISEDTWTLGYPSSPTGTVFRETGFWTFAPVPEPSSAALLALGLLALLRKRAVSLP